MIWNSVTETKRSICFSIGILIHPKRTDSSKEYDIAIIIMEKKPPYTGECGNHSSNK